jgi:hypothetical protein
VLPRIRIHRFWCEQWHGTEERVRAIIRSLQSEGSVITSGGDWDRWDLQVRGGLLGAARLRLAIEEHGGGRQLVRVRSWPRAPWGSLALCGLAAVLALLAALSHSEQAAIALAALAAALTLRTLYEGAVASAAIGRALARTFPPLAHIDGAPLRTPARVARRRAASRPRRPDVRDAA